MATAAAVEFDIRANHARIEQDLKKAGNALEHFGKRSARITKQAAGNQRMMRGVAGNLGHQVQDVAVQLQMGTSAMRVFTQQGSQIAAAFGPTGAVVGAFLAVGGALVGALIPALVESEKKMKDLKKAQEALAGTFKTVHGELIGLSDKLKRMATQNPLRLQLHLSAHIADVAIAQQGAIETIQKKLDEAIGGWFTTEFTQAAQAAQQLERGDLDVHNVRKGLVSSVQEDLHEKYKLTTAEGNKLLKVYEDFERNPIAESVQNLQTVLSELSKTHGGTFAQFARDFDAPIEQVKSLIDQMSLLQDNVKRIDQIKHPALEAVENKLALFKVPEGIERTIRTQQQEKGVDPESEEGQTFANLMRKVDRRTREEREVLARQKRIEHQEKFIAGLGFQLEQLKRSPVEQQIHAALRAQTITDVESSNAHQIRAHIKAIETQKKEIQARNQVLADVKALYNATRTPLERYNAELTQYKELLEGGNINAELYARGLEQIQKRLDDTTGSTARHNQAMAEAQALTRSLMTPQKQYNAQITRFQELLKDGFITQDTFERALAALQPVEAKVIDLRRVIEHQLDFRQPFNTMVHQFTQALSDMAHQAALTNLADHLFPDSDGAAAAGGFTLRQALVDAFQRRRAG